MRRNTEIWIVGGFVIALVIVAALAYFFSGNAPSGFKSTQTSPVISSDWSRGDAAAAVSVIEYGDFECPACGEYEPIVEQLTQQYGDRVRFVFRNFPLYQIHPFAMIAAQAAEAAGLQGKFWEMHDLLYKNQNDWSGNTNLSSAQVVSQYFDAYAQQLGLNVTQFDADINSSTVKNKVQHDIDLGNAAQVDHTPTFFINLVQIPNPSSLAGFQAAIDAALASSSVAK